MYENDRAPYQKFLDSAFPAKKLMAPPLHLCRLVRSSAEIGLRSPETSLMQLWLLCVRIRVRISPITRNVIEARTFVCDSDNMPV